MDSRSLSLFLSVHPSLLNDGIPQPGPGRVRGGEEEGKVQTRARFRGTRRQHQRDPHTLSRPPHHPDQMQPRLTVVDEKDARLFEKMATLTWQLSTSLVSSVSFTEDDLKAIGVAFGSGDSRPSCVGQSSQETPADLDWEVRLGQERLCNKSAKLPPGESL